MTSVPPAAVEQPPIFHVEAERTPLQEAVASELGEGLASSGFLVLPSQMEGFVQTGEPRESVEVATVVAAARRLPHAARCRARTTPHEAPCLSVSPPPVQASSPTPAAANAWATKVLTHQGALAHSGCSHLHRRGTPF